MVVAPIGSREDEDAQAGGDDSLTMWGRGEVDCGEESLSLRSHPLAGRYSSG
jgi:hypothetical protein